MDSKTPQNFSQDGATMMSKLTTHVSRITSLSNPPNLKSLFHTLLEDIKLKVSEKLLHQLLKDSLALCNSPEETPVRKSKPSESSDTLSKLSTFWPEETHSKSSLRPLPLLDQEKTPPKSVLEVLPESKLLTSHQWEEST